MLIVDEEALRESRCRPACEMCGRRVYPLDPHHCFIKRGMGGGSRLDVRQNLIGLCRVCHQKCDRRSVNREAMEIIAKREKKTIDEIFESLWELLRKPK